MPDPRVVLPSSLAFALDVPPVRTTGQWHMVRKDGPPFFAICGKPRGVTVPTHQLREQLPLGAVCCPRCANTYIRDHQQGAEP